MANRKLGKPTDQRKALLRNQVTNLIWYGRIETTLQAEFLVENVVNLSPVKCPDRTFKFSQA